MRAPQYTKEQATYLVSEDLLASWATLSMLERLKKTREIMPERLHSAYGLRKLYRQHMLKRKKIGIRVELNAGQIVRQEAAKLKGFPLIIDLVESGHSEVIWMDEAVFTIGQTTDSTWMAKKQSIKVTKKGAGYTAIAAVAGMNNRGEVVAMETTETSIKLPELLTYLNPMVLEWRAVLKVKVLLKV